MNDLKLLYLSVIALCILALPAQAQNASNDSTSLKRELTLEREYNPDIDNATKVNQLPELREPQSPKSLIEFSNYAIPYSTSPGLYYLPAQLYASEIAKIKKIGYVTAGISSLVDIDGDLGIQLLNTSKDYLSFYASHRSSNSNVNYIHEDGKQKMKINDNWGGIRFLHDFGKARLNLDAKYTYSAFNYYGQTRVIYFLFPYNSLFAPTEGTTNVDKDKNQANNLFEANAGITSSEMQDISWLFNFNYRHFGQKYGQSVGEDGRKENQFKIDAGASYKFNDDITFGLLGKLQNFSYSSIDERYRDEWSGNLNYTTISLNPHIKMEGSNWNLRLGIKEEFQTGERKKANLSPDIRFNLKPSNRFMLELSAMGGIKENSNYSMFYENRYVNPALRVSDSRTPLNVGLGLDFLMRDNLKLKLSGNYEIIKDEHFFYTYPIFPYSDTHLAGMDMSVLGLDVNHFKTGLSIDYFYQNTLEVKLGGAFHNWTNRGSFDGGDFEAYGKPDFAGDINVGYKMSSLPLRIDAFYHLETGRKFRQTEDENNSINDLSLKGTYLLNDTFSFYLKANNLLFQEYEFWYGYPAQSFNIMGGLSIKF